MSTAKIELWNQATSLAGAKSKIKTETDNSRERELCSLWFDLVRRSTLGAAFWPSAKTHAYLGVVTERTSSSTWAAGDPAPDYKYSYGLPTNVLYPRYLHDYSRFEISWDTTNEKKILSTNTQNALLEYSFDQLDINAWEIGLYTAIIHNLAAMICVDLTGKDKRRGDLFAIADKTVLDARVEFANSNAEHVEVVPDWIQIRGYGGSAPLTRYYYPYEQLLSTAYGTVNA